MSRVFALRAGFAGMTLLGFGAAGWILLPRAWDAGSLLAAADDPAELTRRGLSTELTPARLRTELDSALTADDVDLASSFFAVADQQGLAAPPDLRARYDAATTASASFARDAGDFYHGVRDGQGAGGAGLAGVVTGDLTGVGDLRDLFHEGQKISRGEPPDRLTLGLAAVGLAVTGATIVTVGAALPARAGVSTLRVAARSGRLSKPLAASVGRLAAEAVDTEAVAALATGAARLDLTAMRAAARETVRPAALSRLAGVAEDVSTLGRKAGLRGAEDALAVAHDPAEIGRAVRLAETRGAGTRAVLKVLGRGALALTTGALVLAGWAMAGVGYVWLALLLVLAALRRAGRIARFFGRLSFPVADQGVFKP